MHAEWPIALQLEGNYHNLGLFLDRVSKFPRIINIGNMQSPRSRRRRGASMTINATATTFVLVDTPPPAPDDKKGSQEGAGQSAGEEAMMTPCDRSRPGYALRRSPSRCRPTRRRTRLTRGRREADEKTRGRRAAGGQEGRPAGPPPNF
jgi:hypothetical protein